MRTVIGGAGGYLAGLRRVSALAIWGIATWGLFGFDPSSIELGYWMKCLGVSFFFSASLMLASAKWRLVEMVISTVLLTFYRMMKGRWGAALVLLCLPDWRALAALDDWPADRWSLMMVTLSMVFMNPFYRPGTTIDDKSWGIVITALAPFVMMNLANSWPVHEALAKRLLGPAKLATGLSLFWPMATLIMMASGIRPATLKTISAALLLVPVVIIGARRANAEPRERRVVAAVVAMFSASIAAMILYSFHEPGPVVAPLLVYVPMHAVALTVTVCYFHIR